ncbi:hypothetical protein GCM10020331_081520 [Ectobacillus funiculus]
MELPKKIMKRFEKKHVGAISPFDNVLVFKNITTAVPSSVTTMKIQSKFLLNAVNHPNAGGILVLGLGCENNELPEFKKRRSVI